MTQEEIELLRIDSDPDFHGRCRQCCIPDNIPRLLEERRRLVEAIGTMIEQESMGQPCDDPDCGCWQSILGFALAYAEAPAKEGT